jgi:uncharacterized membrane protein
MADLVVITFPSEAAAEDVRRHLLERQKEYLVELGDAVIAVRGADGAIRLNQLINPAPVGAIYGGMWGFLIGLIFMVPLVGAAFGSAAGAIAGALSDVGIDDRFMRDTAKFLHQGRAALFLLVNKMTTEKILTDFKDAGGTVLQTSFDPKKEAVLRTALDGARRSLSGTTPKVASDVDADEEERLERGLEDSFPASDPPAVTSTVISGGTPPKP